MVEASQENISTFEAESKPDTNALISENKQLREKIISILKVFIEKAEGISAKADLALQDAAIMADLAYGAEKNAVNVAQIAMKVAETANNVAKSAESVKDFAEKVAADAKVAVQFALKLAEMGKNTADCLLYTSDAADE